MGKRWPDLMQLKMKRELGDRCHRLTILKQRRENFFFPNCINRRLHQQRMILPLNHRNISHMPVGLHFDRQHDRALLMASSGFLG